MRNKWLLILLLVSVAVNLGVLGTLVVKWLSPPKSELADNEFYGDDNKLQARGELQKIRKQMQATRDQNRPLIEKSQQARKDFVAVLSETKFDKKKASTYLEKFLKARSAMESSLGEGLIDIRAQMTDSLAAKYFQQRQIGREMLRERLAERAENRGWRQGDSLETPRERIRQRIRERIRNRRLSAEKKE